MKSTRTRDEERVILGVRGKDTSSPEAPGLCQGCAQADCSDGSVQATRQHTPETAEAEALRHS